MVSVWLYAEQWSSASGGHWLLLFCWDAIVGLLNGGIIALTGMPPFIVTLSLQGTIRGIAYVITDGRSVSCDNAVFNAIGNG